MADNTSSGARTRARELAVQALYQKQIAGHDLAELKRQFVEQVAYERVDQDYFLELLSDVIGREPELGDSIDGFIDRPRDQLDPVEYAVLLIGTWELQSR
ncbi:MAG: transcription antitermination factor NusB, partial [Pseudomonadota bacterium]